MRRSRCSGSHGLTAGQAAIEVYPKATLKAHGLPFSGYKGTGPGHREVREDLATALGQRIALDLDLVAVIADDDLLDAAVCVLAGHDFLTGNSQGPAVRRTMSHGRLDLGTGPVLTAVDSIGRMAVSSSISLSSRLCRGPRPSLSRLPRCGPRGTSSSGRPVHLVHVSDSVP